MKITKLAYLIRNGGKTIAVFGKARLLRTNTGRIALEGGSPDDRQAAKEWCSLFLHNAAIEVTAQHPTARSSRFALRSPRFAPTHKPLVTNGLTSAPVQAAANIKASLYWSPLGTNNFTAIGSPVAVGTITPGLFWGGVVSTGPLTPGGSNAQFQVRAWGGGYATYEEAFQVDGTLIGASTTITQLTGAPAGTPPSPPVSLALNGLQGFILTPHTNQSAFVLTCVSNKSVACGSAWSFDPPATSGGCSTNHVITVLITVTNGNCPWMITRTWEATDGCTTNSCSQVVTVVDTTPPVLVCASNKTVECGSVWDFDAPVASDACSGTNVLVTVLDTQTNGVCPKLVTRTWLAVDGCNNSNTCSQVVTVADTTPPVLVCASNKTVECGSVWDFDAPVASDACAGTNVLLTVLNTVTNGTFPHSYTRTWAAVDPCANTNTCSQTVTLENTAPLIVFCPTNKVVSCSNNWDFDLPAVGGDDCGTNVTISVLNTVTNTVCPLRIARTWGITNLYNNDAALCSQWVTVLCPDCPVLVVTKQCPPNPVPPGGILNFTGTVTNVSEATLTNVIVLNDQPFPNTLVFGPTVLAPGQGVSFAGSYEVSAADCGPYTDTLTALGSDTDGLVFTNSASAVCPRATVITPGDRNGDGIVDQAELDAVLANYWPYSPWLYLTNTAGLGGTNVTFALSNSLAGAYSVWVSTNLTDWEYLGPATPRYEFIDTNAPAIPERYYRLSYP